MKRQYDNVFLNLEKTIGKYTSKKNPRDNFETPIRNRQKHGEKLKKEINDILNKNTKKISCSKSNLGTYLDFESSPNFELKIKSLEDSRSKIKLVNVQEKENVQKATIFIPNGKEHIFLKKITQYLEEDNKNNKPKNKDLIESINDIKETLIESFWIGNIKHFPKSEKKWCEIWVRDESDYTEKEFRELANKKNIRLKRESLSFPERKVFLAETNKKDLMYFFENSNLLAEIRLAKTSQNIFVDMSNYEQIEWGNDLKDRIKFNNDSNIYISILDTGINNKHLLIDKFLSDNDINVYNKEWSSTDLNGHGTAMAGVVLYGDLEEALSSSKPITINHRLESVKILPDNSKNDPQLFGAITVDSVSNLQIKEPNRKRSICMAVTTDESDEDGVPTSWSAAIDESASGYIDGIKKLYIISAGNINNINEYRDYPESNKRNGVQDPAQSWNCLTVGAYTKKDQVDYEKYGLKAVLANYGGLSPFSRTSSWWDNKWPIKPEVLFEGGNLLQGGDDWFSDDCLDVLTLNNHHLNNQFTTFRATSSATAFASNFVAKLLERYPDAWPETIRGLVVHSAEWTSSMKEQFLESESKTDYKKLLRICGYGVPNLERAISCAENSVNLIIESEIQPFELIKSNVKTKEMDIYELPWPKNVLEGLFNTEVTLKVTLSYFIEPSPGEIGWKDKYKYSSCNLRFDINGANTKGELMARISKAVELEEDISTASGVKWTLGSNNRTNGSIHSDSWTGTAAELANSNYIVVYPVSGWWKERKHLECYNKKIRYSLIVSLSTPKSDAKLYTEIKNKIKNKVKNKVKNEFEIYTENKAKNKVEIEIEH